MLGKHLGMFKEVSVPDTEVKFICELNIVYQRLVTSNEWQVTCDEQENRKEFK